VLRVSSKVKPTSHASTTAPTLSTNALALVTLGTGLVLVTYVTRMATIADTLTDLHAAFTRSWKLWSPSGRPGRLAAYPRRTPFLQLVRFQALLRFHLRHGKGIDAHYGVVRNEKVGTQNSPLTAGRGSALGANACVTNLRRPS
jgi:hypothetical protein